MQIDVKIKKLNPEAIIPNYALPGDVGLDLYSLEDHELQPGEKHIFKLGFALEFPNGYAAIVKDKGGMAFRTIHALGGVFDAGYRGEYLIQLINLGKGPYKIEKGHKIAQLILYPVAFGKLTEVDELSDSERGQGRWGSTGKY
ncbi:MAG: dUTP diphosphatase [bacterium]